MKKHYRKKRFWLLLTPLVVLCSLVFTHSGNKVLLTLLQHYQPQLHITLENGSVFFSPKISELSYQDSDVTVQASNINFTWQWRCFWQSKICAQTASIDQLNIDILPSMNQNTSSGKPLKNKKPTWTTPIFLKQLAINNILIENDQHTVALRNVNTAFSFVEMTLDIAHLSLENVDVENKKTLPVTSAINNQSNEQKINILQQQLSKLSNQTFNALPIRINVQSSQLAAFSYPSITITNIKARGNFADNTLTNIVFSAQHQQDTMTLSGQLALSKHFPFHIEIKGQSNNKLLGVNSAQLEAQGSLASFSIQGASQGDINAMVNAEFSPLTPNVPFHITGQLSQHTIEGITLSVDKISADGSLKDYQLALQGKLASDLMPNTTLLLNTTGTLQQFNDVKLTLNQQQQSASFHGNVGWHQALSLDGDITFNNINPSVYSKLLGNHNLTGSISGRLATSATWQPGQSNRFNIQDSQWHLTVDDLSMTGEWASLPVTLQGNLIGNNLAPSTNKVLRFGQWQFNDFNVIHGKNQAYINGELTDTPNLRADIKIDDLAASLPFYQSQTPTAIDGQLSIIGDINTAKLNTQLTINNINLKDTQLAVDTFTLNGNISLTSNFMTDIQIQAHGVDFNKYMKQGELSASLVGSKLKHQFIAHLSNDTLSNSLTVDGSFAHDTWQAVLQQAGFTAGEHQITINKPVSLSAHLATKVLTIGTHCWQSTRIHLTTQLSKPSELCLQTPFTFDLANKRSNRGILKLAHFNIAQLQGYLPNIHQVTGQVDGHLTFQSFNSDNLNLSTHLVWKNGKLISDLNNQLLSHDIDTFTVEAAIDTTLASINAKLSSPTLGDVTLSLVSNIFAEAPFVSGNIASQGLELAPYRPYLKYVNELEGQLSINAGFSGDLTQQHVFGSLSSNDIILVSDKLPSRIDNLNTTIEFKGANAAINSYFELAKGQGALTGTLSWLEQPHAQLTFSGEQLTLMPQAGINVTLNPKLTLNLTSQQADVSGNVHIDRANIVLDSLPDSAVTLSPDITVKNQQQASSIPLHLDITTHLGDNLFLEAFGLTSQVAGKLQLTQSDTTPLSVLGELSLHDANYKAFGQQLIIEQGQIIFTGSPTNPVVNIKAIRDPERTNDNVIAGVYVNGAVEQPKLTIFSEPALEQQQAISYLIRGYGLGSDSNFGQNMAIAMLVNNGLGGASRAINTIGSAFGIDNLNITTSGSGDQTRLEFSGSIGPKLQLRYGVGVFDSLPEVGLRYQINRRLFVEFINNTEQALDLLYQFSFD